MFRRRWPLALLAFLLVAAVATAQAGGGPGSAVRFYGTGADDTDRIKLRIDGPPNSADVGAGDFTIEFWMKANLADNESGSCDDWICGNIIFDRDIFAGQARDYGISMRNGVIYFGTGGSTEHVLRGDQNVADGAWHHIAVTRVRATGQKCLYIDGVLDVPCEAGTTEDISYPDGYLGSWPNDPFLVVGAEKHDVNNQEYPSFSGTLDEIRIWNVARTQQQIADNRTVSLTGAEAGLVLYWRLDEGSGTIATDASGDGNHGEVRTGTPGAAEWVTSTAPIGGGGGGGPDTDGDGCTEAQELGPDPAFGGSRDPNFFWDFFDTPDAANVRDRAITVGDIFRVVSRFGRTGNPAIDPLSLPPPTGYHTAFDRSPPSPGGNLWNSNAADGTIVVNDILLGVVQFGHRCAG